MHTQKKKVAEISVDQLETLIRKVVKEELRQRISDFFVSKDGIKISVLLDEEDPLEMREEFKKDLRRAIGQVKNRKTISLARVRKEFGL